MKNNVVKNNPSYTITELAKEFSVTNRSIRHYEDYGLISPQRNGTQRIYSARDRVRLQLILRGKRVGFSLAEIKEIIDLYEYPLGEQKQREFLLSKIQLRRVQLEHQIKDIQSMMDELGSLENRVLGALDRSAQDLSTE